MLTVLRRAFPVKLYAWQPAEKRGGGGRRRNGKYTLNGSRGYSSLMLAAKCPLLYPFPFFFPPPLFFSFILECPNFFARQISLCLVLREPPLSRFISFRSLFSVAPVQRGGIIENYFRPFYYSFEYLFFLSLFFNFFFQGIVSYLYIYIWSFD